MTNQIIVHELELSTKNNYLVETKHKSFRTSEQKELQLLV